jgi:hypothetical protein
MALMRIGQTVHLTIDESQIPKMEKLADSANSEQALAHSAFREWQWLSTPGEKFDKSGEPGFTPQRIAPSLWSADTADVHFEFGRSQSVGRFEIEPQRSARDDRDRQRSLGSASAEKVHPMIKKPGK